VAAAAEPSTVIGWWISDRMPASARLLFTEPAEYQAALRREGFVRFITPSRNQFQARLRSVRPQHLYLLAAEEQMARIATIVIPDNTMLVAFSLEEGGASVWGGVPMQTDDLVILAPHQRIHSYTVAPCRWGAIRMLASDVAAYGRAVVGAPFAVPPVSRWLHPPPRLMRHLLDLHTAAVCEGRPQILLAAEAARGLEQQIIESVIECLSIDVADAATPAIRASQELVERFEDIISTRSRHALHMADICSALGVSRLTLRQCCDAQLGMNPIAYIRLWRRCMADVH
jgi:hypothetical protein